MLKDDLEKKHPRKILSENILRFSRSAYVNMWIIKLSLKQIDNRVIFEKHYQSKVYILNDSIWLILHLCAHIYNYVFFYSWTTTKLENVVDVFALKLSHLQKKLKFQSDEPFKEWPLQLWSETSKIVAYEPGRTQ